MKSGPQRDAVCVGQFGAAHGVRGEIRLKPFTATPEGVAAYGPLFAEDGRVFEIEALRPAKEVVIVRVKGIRDRNAAEALNRVRLYVPRERLPAPDEDEFYHADLIGLQVETTAGEIFGRITALHDFGAGDLLEVAPAAGGPTVLVPFTKAAVPSVDLAAGRVVVAPEAVEETDEAAKEPPARSLTAGPDGR